MSSYNSVVFSSLVPVGYDIWFAQSTKPGLDQSEFLERSWNVTGVESYRNLSEAREEWANLTSLGASNKLRRFTNLECIRQYATPLQTSYKSLILIGADTLKPSQRDSATLRQAVDMDALAFEWAYDWVCGLSSCPMKGIPEYPVSCRDELPTLEKGADAWAPFCHKIAYCYSEPVEEKCQLTFSPAFMVFVLVSNALKAAILLYVALRPPEESLFVLGDAIESFLTVPDAFSSDSCLASAGDIKQKQDKNWTGPRPWTPVRRRWAAAISRRRWIVSLLLQV